MSDDYCYLIPSGTTLTSSTSSGNDSSGNPYPYSSAWPGEELAIQGTFATGAKGNRNRVAVTPHLALLPGGEIALSTAYGTIKGDTLDIRGTASTPALITYSYSTADNKPSFYAMLDIAFTGAADSVVKFQYTATGSNFSDRQRAYRVTKGFANFFGTAIVDGGRTYLELASDLPGTVAVTNGGCLVSADSIVIGTLSLEDGTALDLSDGGTITVATGFSASGTIMVRAAGGASFPREVLVVPTTCGTLDIQTFRGDGTRLSVAVENGIQTLYAEPLEPTVFDATTGYVKQLQGGTSASSTYKNPFDIPEAWSDNRTPHADTNYYGNGKGIYITTNSVFAGRSLTIEDTVFRVASGKTVTISDLRVKGGTSDTRGVFTSAGAGGTYYLAGGMEILSLLTDSWPFAFLGGNDGQTWSSSQKITGGSMRAFELRGATSKAPGAVYNYVEFLGDLSEYRGTIIVGTNFTARLGGSAMPGSIRLDTNYSHVETMAAEGADVKIGKLESLISTYIAIADTNTLSVADALSVTGTLTKNGGGLLAAGGTAYAGAAAALNIAAGGLRADSAHAFDGIAITFSNGTRYVRDLATDCSELVQCGLYNTSTVTALGVLNVGITNCSNDGNAQEVALFTVPESCAEALQSAIRFSPRPKGYNVKKIVVDAGSGQKTVKAVLSVTGMVISFK